MGRPLHPSHHSRAFTLIELIVVVVLTAIIAGIIVPRLMQTGEREARAEADAVASLVGAAARRAGLATQRIALDFSEGRFQGMMLRSSDPESFAAADMLWAMDPFLPTLDLSHLTLVGATADGANLDDNGWRLELGAHARPELLILLEDSRGQRWTVLLSGDGEGAIVFDGENLPESYAGRVVDLDRSGRGLGPW